MTTNRKFIIELQNEDKELETKSLLGYMQKFLNVEVRELTSLDEEIMEAKVGLTPNEAAAFDEIMPIFYNNVAHTREFLIRIRGLKPKTITAHVNILLCEGNYINPEETGTSLWRALYDHNLYPRQRVTWLSQVIIQHQ